jgi:hypothetical protein
MCSVLESWWVCLGGLEVACFRSCSYVVVDVTVFVRFSVN